MVIKFRTRMVRYALTAFPIAGGAGTDGADDAGDKDKDDDAADKADADDDAGDDDADADDDGGKAPAAAEPDWKRMARKHEREAKKARKEVETLNSRLQARDDADKSEQEKAIEEAEQRARTEAEGKFDKERRQDRLELATTKIAAKGLKLGTGDDAKTVRFADPDDALLHLERDIRNGDLDPEDIFDSNGRVRNDQLEDALTDLLSRKPHLAADTGRKVVAGTADAGKGTAAKTDSTVEDHLNKIRRHRRAA
jgi:hypothetical protein